MFVLTEYDFVKYIKLSLLLSRSCYYDERLRLKYHSANSGVTIHHTIIVLIVAWTKSVVRRLTRRHWTLLPPSRVTQHVRSVKHYIVLGKRRGPLVVHHKLHLVPSRRGDPPIWLKSASLALIRHLGSTQPNAGALTSMGPKRNADVRPQLGVRPKSTP